MLVWGLDAVVVTFVAPHSLHARPLVVGRDADLVVTNRSPDVDAVVLVDGHRGRRARAGATTSRAARPEQRSLLATLPEQTFFRRYAQTSSARRRQADVRVTRSSVTDSRRSRVPRRTMTGMLRRLRIENLVLIREAELEFDAGPERDHRRDRRGQDDPLERDRPAARRDAATRLRSAPPASEAYVEAELDLPDDEALGALAELRPEGEEALVLARRIFADGRTRAYAWGRSAAREDVAAAVEALLAMSGQFEQRRLARPATSSTVLDAFAGDGRVASRDGARAPGASCAPPGAATTS